MIIVVTSNSLSPINPITAYLPNTRALITDFIDKLVSLKVDPEAEFSKKINTYVQEMDERYTVGFEIFNNRDLLKNLSFPALVK
jgi:hypothetical protein